MSSGGMVGTSDHGPAAKSASWMRVKTLTASAPPALRIASRARIMCGASTESPIILSAK
jgi:hypothetical protein